MFTVEKKRIAVEGLGQLELRLGSLDWLGKRWAMTARREDSCEEETIYTGSEEVVRSWFDNNRLY